MTTRRIKRDRYGNDVSKTVPVTEYARRTDQFVIAIEALERLAKRSGIARKALRDIESC